MELEQNAVASPNDKVNFIPYRAALKAEIIKNFNLYNVITINVLALLGSLFYFLYTVTVERMEGSPFETATGALYFSYYFFTIISLPILNAVLTSTSYGIEIRNKTQKILDTQPLKKATLFYAKLTYALIINAFAITVSTLAAWFSILANRSIIEDRDLFGGDFLHNALVCILSVLIGSIPVIAFHMWLSYKKVSQLWNSFALISLSWLSFTVLLNYAKNQWYNFYVYPIALSKSLGRMVTDGPLSSGWSGFSSQSYNFTLLSAIVYSIIIVSLIIHKLNKGV